jgi:hypothetical protein
VAVVIQEGSNSRLYVRKSECGDAKEDEMLE